MKIRPYKECEVEHLAILFTNTVRSVNIRDYSPEQVAVWAPEPPDYGLWRSRLQKLKVWVAEKGHNAVGFCGLGPGGHLDLFYVHHEHQRQGVGRRMYQQVESEARHAGDRRIFTEASITAKPFFETMGFNVLGGQNVKYRDMSFANYFMEKWIL